MEAQLLPVPMALPEARKAQVPSLQAHRNTTLLQMIRLMTMALRTELCGIRHLLRRCKTKSPADTPARYSE